MNSECHWKNNDRMNSRFVILLVLLKQLLSIVYAWDVSLVIETYASNAVGGEAFQTQPKIHVYNQKKTKQYTDIEGNVVASISSPFESERLGVIRNGICESDAYKDGVFVSVAEGKVAFVDLCINRFGTYVLHFELFDEYGILLGNTDIKSFHVVIGSPYKIGIIQMPTNVLGGRVWSVNPIVAVQDRGRNTIASISYGNVSVSLANKQSENYLRVEVMYQIVYDDLYRVTMPKSILWSNGTAEFKGLFVDIASTGYRLNFTTDLDLPGSKVVISEEINVQIGSPKALIEVEGPHLSPVTGGKVFIHQPVVNVVDDGGNLVTEHRSMLVSATLCSNPTNSSLLPFDSAWATVENGVAVFRDLYIQKAGDRYNLRYALWTLEADDMYHRNNITTHGE